MQERLQKVIARAGIASRRKAEDLILQGRVKVNGRVIATLGVKVDPNRDHVKVDGRLLRQDPLVYYAVYKPQGILCTVSDESNRPKITDLVRTSKRVYPAGRLDFDSEGLIILTNDGELAKKVTEGGKIAKSYRVKVSGSPSRENLQRLRRGLRLRDGTEFAPCKLKLLKRRGNSWFEIILKEGKNRQIRRMFEEIGHRVMRLRRITIGCVSLEGLKPGTSRKLTSREVELLLGPAAE